MGSLCGSNTTTSNTSQSTTPVAQGAIQDIYGKVASAASTPYTPYSGELTAGINGQQTAGISGINNAAGYASPYFSQAGQLASGAANPLTGAQIQQYQNPYIQNVVNATQAQFNNQNAQGQNALKGTAAQQGALGGDRQAVAQAVLAGQQQTAQAPTIANLYANSYNSGLQTAGQQFQQNPLAAAGALQNIGAGGQSAALQGAGAQINAGTLQQQTQQAGDTANYGQYQAQQAFPYQQAAFLQQYGLPSALAQGSSSTGTQTTTGPAPNPIAQYGGTALTAAALLAKDGGRIEGYAPGGGIGYINAPDYITSGGGYLPTGQASQNTLQAPSLSFLKPQAQSSAANPMSGTNLSGLTSLKNNFGSASYGGGNMFSGDEWGGDKNNPAPGLTADDYGYASGGLVDAIHHIHRAIKGARGGRFDDGGDVSFADRFQPAIDAPLVPFSPQDSINPDTPFRMPDQKAVQAWRKEADQPAVTADSQPPAALPKEIINPDNAPPPNPMTTAFAPGDTQGPMGANGLPTVISPVSQPTDSGGHGLFGMSDKTKQSLLAAGLGMLASRSPFLGNALGEGGLQGLKAYSDQTNAEQAAADKAATRGQTQQQIDLRAKELADTLEQHRRTAASADLIPDAKGNLIPNPAKLEFLKKQADINTKDSYSPIGSVVSADGTTHPLVMNKADGKILDSVTGQPPQQTDKIQTGKNDPGIVDHLAHGIESGAQPPSLTGLYGKSGDVRAKLDEHGFDLAKAQIEWKRAEKQVATLNGPQMTRFVGLAKSVDSTIDEVRNLAKQMDNSGIPKLNAAKLALYMQAEGNSENGQLAARYIGAVNTLKEEFANLANGGYAPTEPAWELANKQINGDYGVKQLGASLDEVQRLVRYRVNAIPGLSTMGAGAANRYTGQQQADPATGAPATPAVPARIEKTLGDKKYYSPDGGKTWYAQ